MLTRNLTSFRGEGGVQPQLINFAGLGALFLVHQVDRFFAHHRQQVAGFGHQADALTDQHLGIPAAQALKVNQSVCIHMGDNDPDLIQVSREHHSVGALRVEDRKTVAIAVFVGLVCKSGSVFQPHCSGALLVSCRAGGFQQGFQKSDH